MRYTFECTLIEGERICTEDDLLHLEDGSLIKLSAIHSFEPLRPYTGTLLDPPGLVPILFAAMITAAQTFRNGISQPPACGPEASGSPKGSRRW